MRLAIVGSVSLAGEPIVYRLIEGVLDQYRPSTVVSGGAPGVDSMAAEVAREWGLEVVEHFPAEPSWERGYKPRNLRIAEDCDRLVRIVAHGSTTYGSGWTRDRARELGKPTDEYVIADGRVLRHTP